MNNLEVIFGELGISQYIETFLDQGFDTWETILDITESDLDALGVKLGHRRKLQRRIANHRGLAPVASLVSPARTSIEDASVNAVKLQQSDVKDVVVSTKRKYRRHPKPDPNAPERPPSAYVLFSNKTRDGLKGQNLTFTEIAKLVGENWQNLDRSEKEPYESQALEAKEKYNRDMNDYKKTAEYKKYSDYLQDFRKRQATQDKDASKRIKTEAERDNRASSTEAVSAKSNAGSGSESQQGSEPPPTRQPRLGSVTSQSDARISPMVVSPHGPPRQSNEIPIQSPRSLTHEMSISRARGYSNPNIPDSSEHGGRRFFGPLEGLRERQRPEGTALANHGPAANPVDLRLVAMPISESPETRSPSIAPNLPHTGSSGQNSASSRFWSRPPSLHTEPSSTGSISSHSSYLPRTPSESSLPIHALLSSKPTTPTPQIGTPLARNNKVANPPAPNPYPGRCTEETYIDGWSLYDNSIAKADISSTGGSDPPYPGSYFPSQTMKQPPSVGATASTLGVLHEQATQAPRNPHGIANPSLDGMRALLQASDIVDRQNPGN